MSRPAIQTGKIWLIRHGETAWSETGQHTGRTDLPLLPEAEPKLVALKPHIQGHNFELVLSSPLLRARRTAELIGFQSFQLDDNLMEWDYGAYEGKTRQDILQQVPGWSLWTEGVVGGETLADVARRAQNVLQRASTVSGDVALVAHGHILAVLAACWLELPPAAAQHFVLATASISVLARESGVPILAQWNWQPGNR